MGTIRSMFTARQESSSISEPARLARVDLFRLLASNAAVRQSYETLMTQLRLLGRKPLQTLLFTSTQPEEGKTTVVIGLALAMARGGKRVLVVDADLRRPAIHRVLPVENLEGFGAVLADPSRAGDVVQTIQVPGTLHGESYPLSVVAAGIPNDTPPFQLLSSAALAEAIARLAAGFDAVLIDSPPILSVSDPLLFASLVDGVVLILRAGAVDERDAKLTMEQLRRASAEVLGVVMNHFDERLHGPSLHPYHAYYASHS